jgi:photosystem II stability/assembly factor-like uncharacterized protein
MSSGGKGSGMYKSIDGDTWKSLNENQECQLELRKMGIACSSKSESLVCFDRKTKGGLYRSDDAGEHWELINEDKNLWQRPWYYMNLQTDPKNENGLIVLNVDAWKSDGGKSKNKCWTWRYT